MTWESIPATLMPCSEQRLLRQLETSNDRWMGDNEAVIPHDREAERIPFSVINKVVLVLTPAFPYDKRILHPWFLADNPLHENLDPIQTVRKRP
jgi:hypothetical protein